MEAIVDKQKLHQRLSDSANTTVKHETNTEVYRENLNILSKWVFEQQDDILPIQENATLKNLGPIFTLSQVEATISSNRKETIICPNAALPSLHINKIEVPHTLRFRCYCGDSEHASLLEYKWYGKSLCIKEISVGQPWTWNIVLYKHLRKMFVRLANVRHDEYDKLELFSQRLVKNFTRTMLFHSRDSFKSSMLANIYGDTFSALRSKCDLSISAKQFLFIEFKIGNKVHKRPMPLDMPRQLVHYECGPLSSYKSNRRDTLDEYQFTSSSSFDLITGEPTQAGTSYNKIEVYHHTVISSPGDPFTVTIDNVSWSSTKPVTTVFCDTITFKFTHKEAADMFRRSLQEMQFEVRKRYVCSKLYGESTVYLQSTKSHPSTKFELLFDQKLSGYRILVSREEVLKSICVEVGKVFLDDPRHVRQDYIMECPIWELQHLESEIYTLEKLRWHQLFDQRMSKRLPPMSAAGKTMLSRRDENSSEVWMEDFEELIAVLQPKARFKETDDKYKPVRIAVLDTGIAKDHRLVLKKKIIYRDFVDNQDDEPQDNTGHGTSSVELILKSCVGAELFVGRIFANNTSDAETGPKLMAAGIDWARNNHVNIISISAGFKGTIEGGCPLDLRAAVEAAAGIGILIFAAASNWANKDRIPYPAAITDDVMCIFATDGGNRIVREINPDPRPRAHNFAILGADVPIIEGREKETGTSIATALAAGLAGILVDFSRHVDCRETIPNRNLIERKAGMTAIFSSMSLGIREGYDCVLPMELLPDEIARKTRAEKRAYVRGKLNLALRNAN